MTSIDWDKYKRFWDGTGPTAEATARWERECKFGSERELGDQMVESLMSNLYYAGKVGWAAAEFNLEEAGLIEMIQGHRAGLLREGVDNGWCDLRWTLTDRGRRARPARLERVMLRDPPQWVAEWDAEDEANDVATDCGGCDVDDPILAIHRRNSINLDKRAEALTRAKLKKAKGGRKGQ